jgi:putative AlgH/UPF0301 family transcriptional regulator
MFLGGPCEIESCVTMLHGIRKMGRSKNEIIPGLWLGSPKTLAKAVKTVPLDDRRFKVMTGYAAWSPGELEEEISRGAWHLVEPTPDLILDGDPGDLWLKLCPRPSAPTFSVN